MVTSKAKRDAAKRYRKLNSFRMKLYNAVNVWKRQGKTMIFNQDATYKDRTEKVCYFCARPWNWFDLLNKRKRDVLDEDIIVTCDQCHHVYNAFDREEELVQWCIDTTRNLNV